MEDESSAAPPPPPPPLEAPPPPPPQIPPTGNGEGAKEEDFSDDSEDDLIAEAELHEMLEKDVVAGNEAREEEKDAIPPEPDSIRSFVRDAACYLYNGSTRP